jgi:hypothetical protein
MDPTLLQESENIEDRRDEPLPPDWLTQQERPDLLPGVIGSDAYLARRKREGLIRSGYTSLDPQQLAYQIAVQGSQSPNPYNALVGASPPQQQFAVGRPTNFYSRLQQRFGAVPGAPPSDLREFTDQREIFPDADVEVGPLPTEIQVSEDEDTVPLPRSRPSESDTIYNRDQPYTVHSNSKITLSPTAQEWAREHGMSLTEMARYLLQRDKMRNAGLTD